MAIDVRVRFTKRMIKEVFFQLLEEKPLEKITVSEICSRSEINRTTFYRYYDNPYDLVNKIEQEILDEIVEEVNNIGQEDIEAVFRVILTSVKNHLREFELFVYRNNDRLFLPRMMELCKDKCMSDLQRYFPHLDYTRCEFIYDFLGEGCMGMLKQWIAKGQPIEIEEVISMASWMIGILNIYLPAKFDSMPEIKKIRMDAE